MEYGSTPSAQGRWIRPCPCYPARPKPSAPSGCSRWCRSAESAPSTKPPRPCCGWHLRAPGSPSGTTSSSMVASPRDESSEHLAQLVAPQVPEYRPCGRHHEPADERCPAPGERSRDLCRLHDHPHLIGGTVGEVDIAALVDSQRAWAVVAGHRPVRLGWRLDRKSVV